MSRASCLGQIPAGLRMSRVSGCALWSRKCGRHQCGWPGSETLSFLAEGRGEGSGWELTMSSRGPLRRDFKTAVDAGKETFGTPAPSLPPDASSPQTEGAF